ncbi:hypothetical protein DENIS_3209 [Desulfonema ishimotonii]|uniref:Major facilitator superfamily (MFS) profile domain-containing protein n=1 Tax=Desulfonema ishimotonii TaxID=45657 RepID=A0A401FZ60_9BACT|nr:MFS transporter [Desulfonema ishimotonii]GBC62240.1 hypothetical protein DENIS_3209 [Desulfonema ishimotonii]
MFRRGLFYSYLAIYLRYFLALSVTQTTLFATLPMLLNVIFQTFVWGPVSDRFQLRRTLIIRGELLAGIGTVLLWYAHTLTENQTMAGYILIAGLSVIEIFWSMSNVGWSALISDIYPGKERNAVQGRLTSIGGVGRIAGIWIGGLLYDGLGLAYEGWGFHRGALFFIASGAMFVSVLPMLLVPEGGILREKGGAQADAPDIPAGSHRIFMIFLAAMVFINFGRNAVAVILTPYLVLDSGFGVSSRVVSYIVNMQSVGIIITGLAMGWSSRRLGDGKTLCIGTVLAAASLLIFALCGTLPLIYVSSFLRGTSEVIIFSSAYAFASVLIPAEQRGRQFSYFNATFFLSWGTAGTFIAGPIIDYAIACGAGEMTAYRLAFFSAFILTLIGLGILAVLLFCLLPKQHPRPAAAPL